MSRFGLSHLKIRNGIDKKSLGRGIGSGCGKTCSYGHKGGKARSGRGAVSWFEGGQMPIFRRLPKRGFSSMNDKSSAAYLNLVDLQRLYDAKVICSENEVNLEVLKNVGAIRKTAKTVRLLAKGELKVALDLFVGYASSAAIKAIEAAGGKVHII
ncbi:MAG: 50S ribosomal protein L15 [Holosporaceae bacterium]|jgi:large subunit ribosomal protein L15|nr:50S ribosomal protein L15 [Holosporaceae bacterium]